MKAKIFAVCAIASTLFATSSQATTVYVTYQGTMSGTDTFGLFGSPGSQLNDVAYQANYVFDVTYGLNNSQAGNGTTAPNNYLLGGTEFGSVSPVMSANFKAGVTTITTDGSYLGQIYGLNYGGSSGLAEQFHQAVTGALGSGINIFNSFFNYQGSSSGLPSSIETAFTYTFNPVTDTRNGGFCEGLGTTCLTLLPESLSVSLTAPQATPLPAALPLFASGAGVLGAIFLRRKRKAQAVA
jgi:hypothetical protein